MFWGVTIDGGKRYSQMVERTFHISMAALEPASAKEPISVMIRHDNSEFLLCSLNTKTILQQYLDLNFTEGEEVSFFLSGPGIVHLTGFLLEDEEEDDEDFTPTGLEDEDTDSSSSEDEAPELIPTSLSKSLKSKDTKRKLESNFNTSKTKKKKKNLFDLDGDDDEDEDEDAEDFLDDEAMEGSEDEESDDEEEVSEDSEEETTPVLSEKKIKKEKNKSPKEQLFRKEQNKTPKEEKNTPKEGKKTPKGEKNTPKGEKKTPKEEKNTPKEEKKTPKHKQGSGDHKPSTESPAGEKSEDLTASKKKKKKRKNKNEEAGTPENGKPDGTPKERTTPLKRVVAGGTVIEERKMGHGPEAKTGKMVHVYYSGKLTSGKQFDSCTSGKPFSFKLGRSEVIKGWDHGVSGMKVGGKRLITVPPQQGYGNQKQGPIPGNSTLLFEVELKAVS